MLSIGSIIARWLKNKFSEATGVHSPLPREYWGRLLHREDFFRPRQIIPTQL